MLRIHRNLIASCLAGLIVLLTGSIGAAAVDPDLVGTWWMTEGDEGEFAGLIVRADGTFIRAANRRTEQQWWDAGTIETAGGNATFTVEESTTDEPLPLEITRTYSFEDGDLVPGGTTTPERYEKVASYANVPSDAEGKWLETALWKDGDPQDVTWALKLTIKQHGLYVAEDMEQPADERLQFWGLIATNDTGTEMKLLRLHTPDADEEPTYQDWNIDVSQDMLEWISDRERAQFSRLMEDVDPNVVGTWVSRDQDAGDYETHLIDDAGNRLDFAVLGDGNYWWMRGSITTTADGHMLSVDHDGYDTRYPDEEYVGNIVGYSFDNGNLQTSRWKRTGFEEYEWVTEILYPAHAISGQLTDDAGDAVPGAILTSGSDAASVTDDNGHYVLGFLDDGGYTVTPQMDGWTFEPSSTDRTVPPDRTNVDFEGQPPPVPPNMAGTWWKVAGGDTDAAALAIRQHGTYTYADVGDDGERFWSAGTFTAADGNFTSHVEDASDPDDTGTTDEGTYQFDADNLVLTREGEPQETYEKVASYANVPSDAEGKWLNTAEWQDGEPQDVT